MMPLLVALESVAGCALAWGLLKSPAASRKVAKQLEEAGAAVYIPQDCWGGLA